MWDDPNTLLMSRPTRTKRKIVVVDDNESIRYLIKLIFRQEVRLEVVGEAATAEEALDVIRREDPDLVVLDHDLAGETNGLELAPVLKREIPTLRVLLFSGSGIEEIPQPMEAIDASVSKADINELLPTVRRLLAG